MSKLIQLEEFAMFALAVFLFYFQLELPGWMFWAFLLAPDLGMIGYAINAKTGAFTYNLTHHKAIAILLWCIGMCLNENIMILSGLILFAHSSVDRVLGYGLKYSDSFKHTHLGMLK